MAYSLARFEGDIDHQVRVADQDTAIEITPGVFIQPHACSYCDQLELDFDSPESRRWLHEKSSIHFGLSMVECKIAAEHGCALFAWILDNLDLDAQMFPTADWPLVAYVGDSRDKVQFGFANMVAAMCCEREYRTGSCWSSKTLTIFRSNNTTMPSPLEAPTEKSKPRVLLPKVINPCPTSEGSLAFARTSLARCLNSEEHKLCPVFEPEAMPKRLVKIGSVEGKKWQISLFEPQPGEMHRYVALSYCWGGEQPRKTTKTNLEQYRLSIVPPQVGFNEYLPSTIRDAITITNKLGFSYLWIDSFCICQDDVQEKAIEISRMPAIYRNAVVTIAASNSGAARDGFLHKRKVVEDPSAVFRLRWRDSGDKSYYPTHRHKPTPDEPYHDVLLMQRPYNVDAEEPLDLRAWTMQERILAARVLEYGSHRLRWICPSTEFDHDQTDGWTARRLQSDIIRDMRTGWRDDRDDPGTRLLSIETDQAPPLISQMPAEVDLIPEGMTAEDLDSATTQWHQIVSNYTSRAMSVQTDRILAISGIAERFNAAHPGQYVAGLWLPHLPGGLLWKPESLWKQAEAGRAELYAAKQLRPREYQGPSWSWVGVNGKIDFEDCLFLYHTGARMKLEISSVDGHLVEAQARYGAVINSCLICRARVRSALWFNELLDKSVSGGPAELLLLDPRAGSTEELRFGIEADCLENEFFDALEGTRSVSVLLVEVLEHDVVHASAPEMPEDDDFLGALIDTAFGPFLGKGPKTFSDFLTPERHQQLMAAQKPEDQKKPTEWQTRGLVLRGLANGTFSRVGTFKHQWGVPSSSQEGNFRIVARVPAPPTHCGHEDNAGENSSSAEERFIPAPVLTTGSQSLFAGLAKVDLTIV